MLMGGPFPFQGTNAFEAVTDTRLNLATASRAGVGIERRPCARGFIG